MTRRLLLLPIIASTLSAFTYTYTHINPSLRTICKYDGRSDTRLAMGLKDLFNKRSKSSDKEDENIESRVVSERYSAVATNIAGFVRNATLYVDEEFDAEMKRSKRARSPAETMEERVRRVNSGKMTEEEKQRFLDSISQRDKLWQKSKSPPIRQELPLNRKSKDPKSNDEQIKDSKSNKSPTSLLASVLNKKSAIRHDDSSSQMKKTPESSWSAVVARRNAQTTGRKNLDEAAKKAWFDMVTSPERFRTFTSVEYTETDEKKVVEEDMGVESIDSQSDLDDNVPTADWFIDDNEDDELWKTETPATESIETNDLKREENPLEVGSTLASRLEYAARLQAEREISMRKMQETQKLQSLKMREAEQKRLMDIARQREDLFRKKEAEALQRKEAEMKVRAKEQEEIRQRAELKRKELESQQDAYWKAKIEEERHLRDQRLRSPQREARTVERSGTSEREKQLREDKDNRTREHLEKKREAQAKAKAITDASALKVLEEKAKQEDEAQRLFLLEQQKRKMNVSKSPPEPKSGSVTPSIVSKPSPVRQQLPIPTKNSDKPSPIRQTIGGLDAPKKRTVRQPLPMSSAETSGSKSKKKVKIDEDAKKRARSFGINLDLL